MFFVLLLSSDPHCYFALPCSFVHFSEQTRTPIIDKKVERILQKARSKCVVWGAGRRLLGVTAGCVSDVTHERAPESDK
jgi:hypothetical protein